ncbi:hypothetical protein Psi02_46180 [Planotetraspora silvatica]|uniref:Orc1-like AAA ATPase domain-containing protein n=1 Tax=Planotetraspora silvatica TaxID=234614 RepID=A0A8J3UTP3_9ACTN|nr:ATP-binding protein [Planotetraspora silvatica]GII48194.1 hypothetical protein Psi02_46180 [Planotetraspora silvatica]
MAGGPFFDALRAAGGIRDGKLEGEPADRELARRAKVSPTTIGHWLAGRHFPQRFDVLRKVIEGLRSEAHRRGVLDDEVADLLNVDHLHDLHEVEARRRAALTGEKVTGAQARSILSGQDGRSRSPWPHGGLPDKDGDLVGREREVGELLSVLDPAGGGPPVALVAGMAGVGKSALVTEVAHTAVANGWFPGGTLFVDLCGYDPDESMDGDQAVRMVLRDLNVPEQDTHPTAKARQAQYRSRLAERGGPVLVVLDGASSDGQVLPLLPGPGGHRVLVTSRHTLDNPRNALHVDLDVLTTAAAVELLGGPGAGDREQERRLAELCGHLPLALQIVAALLRFDRSRPLADLARQLADEHRRLDTLEYRDSLVRGVRAALALSYAKLTDPQKRLLRLLAVNPRHSVGEMRRFIPANPYLSTPAVMALAAAPHPEVRETLLALRRAHLLQQVVRDRSLEREHWRLHDLVHLFTGEQDMAGDEPDAAILRLGRYFLSHEFVRGIGARVLVDGRPAARVEWVDELGDYAISGDVPADHVPPGFEWNAEHRVWANHDGATALRKAWAIEEAKAIGDRQAEGVALAEYGVLVLQEGRLDTAIDALQRSVKALGDTGDQSGARDRALIDLAIALASSGRWEDAQMPVLAIVTSSERTDELRDRAEAVIQETGDRHTQGAIRAGLANILRMKKRPDEAIHGLHKAAAVFRELADRHCWGYTLANLGWALHETSRHQIGDDYLRQADRILKECGGQESARVLRL